MTNDLIRHIALSRDGQILALAEGPRPSPRAGELLIKVEAAGLNRADVLQRQGLYPPPEDASPILGLEVAGTVAATGEGVTGWRKHDRICALTHGGGYAEYAVAPAGQCLPVPDGFSMTEAAALPEALLTIWHNVFQRAGLQPDEKVLIHGGASGMGTVGIMMCRAMGATVYATAGGAQKCAVLTQLGAELAIDYQAEDFAEALGEAGLAGQINVILDMVGGDYIQKNLNVCSNDGRIVNIAYMRGFKAEVNFAPLLLKRITMTGSTLRAQTFAQKAAMMRDIRERIFPHLESGGIRPVIDSTFALGDAQAAHERMESGKHIGKIVLLTKYADG
ncbi:MAG: NAD(P)H-quinone oxidoreductase [Pseudomonadota bacterium]